MISGKSKILLALCLSLVVSSTLAVFPPCQDMGGGMCVPVGKCPPNKKPASAPAPGSCSAGTECCLGVPDGTSCKDQGGICNPKDDCKSTAKPDVAGCDKDQVCCILVN